MTFRKAIALAILLCVSIAVFEFAFLHDFNMPNLEEIHPTLKGELWLFLLLSALFFIPCFALGYGKVNALVGFFPPALLHLIMWLIFIDNLKNSGGLNILPVSSLYPFVAVSSTLSGIFGIAVVYLASKVFDHFSKRAKNVEDLNSPSTLQEDKEKEEVKIESAQAEENKKISVNNNEENTMRKDGAPG